MQNIVYIHASLTNDEANLDPEDQGIAGIYQVLLADDTPADGFANAALDGFHGRVAVGTLDDFKFVVRAGADSGSEVIAQSDAHESYALERFANDVNLIAAPDSAPARPKARATP